MAVDVSLVIQAGGNSSRMGEDKGLKPFLGQPLIKRTLDRLASIGAEILVTTNHPYKYAFLGRCMIPDPIPGKGALGGLYTALFSALFPIVAVAACDMPFVSADLFKEEIRLLAEEDVDVVVPRSVDGLEPLHAVYRRATCLPFVRDAIQGNQLKLIDWFPSVRVREFSMEEAARIEPAGLAFWNVNTPEEFMKAENLARSM